jgi:catechol-2,3-dioxygenase
MNETTQPTDLILEAIVETALYSDDLDGMESFYTCALNLPVIGKEIGHHVFLQVGPSSILLIFKPDATLQGNRLPAHGTTGPGHLAFGVRTEVLDAWRARLVANDIAIEKEMTWPKGGHSIYFRDPAGNSVEIITPSVWGTPNGW